MRPAPAHRLSLVVAAIAAGALAACSLAPVINFVDHTGQDFQVTIGAHTLHVRALGYDDLRYDTNAHRAVIRQGRCCFTYDIPSWGQFIQSGAVTNPNPVAVQFEADKRLYLLPAGATMPLDVAALGALQVAGFPLSPMLTECDEPAASSAA